MLTFICYPKCTTCQKAKALLDSYNTQYVIRDIKSDNPNYDELKGWLALSGLPIRKFFNTSGLLYKSLGLKDKLPPMSEDECLKLLATDGMLVKRPILVDEHRALVGFNRDAWVSVFSEYDRKKLDKLVDDYFNEMLQLAEVREDNETIYVTPLESYRSKDHEAFHLKGLGDSYESIGKLNLFMQCKYIPQNAFRMLPDGYSFRLCRRDEIEKWKRVVAEEQYVDYVTDYYDQVYAGQEDEFFKRCLFVCNADDTPVASCFIWRSYGLINTLGWFRVLPEYEGKGLGRALLSEVLRSAQLPIYLHTQPTSMRAIKLYSDFGFKLITDSLIGNRKNDLDESMPLFPKILPINDLLEMKYTKADSALLEAALSSEFPEF